MNWEDIIEGDYDTYPPEGENVLVTDGTDYDVAWFLMSSEYVWKKNFRVTDNCEDFIEFVPVQWCTIIKSSVKK